jgi:hypothetical protein
MLKNLLTPKLYQYCFTFLSFALLSTFTDLSISYAADSCSNDNDNFCRLPYCDDQGADAGKFHFYDVSTPNPVPRKYNTKDLCQRDLQANVCDTATSQYANCHPDSVYNRVGGFPGSTTERINYCNNVQLQISDTNIGNLSVTVGWTNLFSNHLGKEFTDATPDEKQSLYGNWTCASGRLLPPATAPAPTRCEFPDYSVFSGGLGRSTCSGGDICANSTPQVIRQGSGSNSDKNFFCINDQIIMCPNSVTNYADAKNIRSGCSNFNPLAPTIPTGADRCNINTNNKYFKYIPPYTEISGAEISRYIDCVRRTGKTDLCFAANIGVASDRIYRCVCVEQPGLLCTIGGIAGLPCDPICNFVKSGFNVQLIEPISIQSPLALINVIANFLFWAAVAIFIFNILSAAFSYIRNADQPDKLKEASDHITGTIFGFIFLLVAAGVINYIIQTVTTFGL